MSSSGVPTTGSSIAGTPTGGFSKGTTLVARLKLKPKQTCSSIRPNILILDS